MLILGKPGLGGAAVAGSHGQCITAVLVGDS